MAVNLIRTVAAVISDNSRVDKAPMQDMLSEIIAAINDVDPLLTPSYPNRDAAEVAAFSLPSAVNRIIVQEGDATVTRSRTAFADDPLYSTGARWGVVQRQNMAAIRNALTATAPIPLANIGSSANEITGTVAGSHLSLGVSVVGDGSEAVLVPVQTNTAASPTIAIDNDNARSVRRIDGSDLPAGALIVGQPYIIRRTAGQYRIVRGDVTSVEVATIRSELAPVQSTIIASSSPSQRDIRGILRPNTFIAITDAVITGSPFSAFNPVSGSLSVLPISGGVKHEWREPNGRIWTNYHQNGAWTGWALQLNKAAVDGSISAQSLRIGKVERFKSILEAISATDTIVVGQIADMSGLSSTSSSGAAVMVLTGTAFLNGGMLRRVQFFSTAGAARVAAVTTWSADGEGRRLYARKMSRCSRVSMILRFPYRSPLAERWALPALPHRLASIPHRLASQSCFLMMSRLVS